MLIACHLVKHGFLFNISTVESFRKLTATENHVNGVNQEMNDQVTQSNVITPYRTILHNTTYIIVYVTLQYL